MSLKKSKIALAVAAAAGLTFSSGAFATNGILQAGNGMVAHGFGGAGLSNAGEAAAGMDNPALISETGDSLSVSWSMFSPDRTTSLYGGAYEIKSDAKVFAIPQIAFTSKINNNMSWGVMAYALGGMNTDYRTDVVSGFFFGGDIRPSTVDLSGLVVAPTLSFKVNDNIAIGASLLIAYENFRARNLFGSESFAYFYGGPRWGTNEGSAMGYGVKLGADFKVTKGISIGAMVQPKISMEEINWFKNFLTYYVPIFPGSNPFTGDAALTTPNEFGIGGKFAVGNNVDIVADIMYYQWTSVDVFKYFGWDDQTVYKVGVEFRPNDKLALRAGFNYGESPIQSGISPAGLPTVFANYAFPAISETHVTLGLGYKFDKNLAFNAYYLYSPEAKITDAYTPVELKMSQNAFGLGINYAAK